MRRAMFWDGGYGKTLLLEGGPYLHIELLVLEVKPSRRRDCNVPGILSPALLIHLLKREGGCSRMTVSPTASQTAEQTAGTWRPGLAIGAAAVRLERAQHFRARVGGWARTVVRFPRPMLRMLLRGTERWCEPSAGYGAEPPGGAGGGAEGSIWGGAEGSRPKSPCWFCPEPTGRAKRTSCWLGPESPTSCWLGPEAAGSSTEPRGRRLGQAAGGGCPKPGPRLGAESPGGGWLRRPKAARRRGGAKPAPRRLRRSEATRARRRTEASLGRGIQRETPAAAKASHLVPSASFVTGANGNARRLGDLTP